MKKRKSPKDSLQNKYLDGPTKNFLFNCLILYLGLGPASSNSIDTESCEVEGIHSLAAWKCEAEDENDCANGLAEQKTLLTRFKLLFGRTVDSLPQ
ncbi:hypothetical protein CEXT_290161 [Caerostris extrusa]|uniref:Uncharacterized protein n=1 Tax=Caerostris extrusa TaxID=172846 RepID=A0AAV4NQJ1_CAEEX|nr:hypothetical protein CEXT_290161 [Caerostris extrusa]